MVRLLRLLAAWSVRRILIFILVAAALVALIQVKQAYDEVPLLRGEIARLSEQRETVRREGLSLAASSRRLRSELGSLEAAALQDRLRTVRLEIAALRSERHERSGVAVEALRGDAGAISRAVLNDFRLQLREREEALIVARLAMVSQGQRANLIAHRVRQLDQRISALEREIRDIERRFPLAREAERVPILQDIRGPWRDLKIKRGDLSSARSERANLLRAHGAARAQIARAGRVYSDAAAALQAAAPPTGPLDRTLEQKKDRLSSHWATRVWEAVRPVLGWALWITLLVILVPPALKAFWFFVVAPIASRFPAVTVCPGRAGAVEWAQSRRGTGSPAASAVSWSVLLRPGEELLVRPEYLQSSVEDARIDSQLVLSWAIPFGSVATGLIGLTRIRAEREARATISATQDPLDEVALLEVPDGSAIVFHPRNLIGVLQHIDRPMGIERVWRLGELSSWLRLQLRYIVFHGPCALVVKGARGIAVEPADGGRLISGAATMGWSAGIGYSVRRSETFLAYLTGKQSLFNDSFSGPGNVIYEEMPRAGRQGGLFGRGLEGLGDAMLKIVGL